MNSATSTEVELAVRAESVHRGYRRGGSDVPVLRGVTVQFRPGTFTAVMGPSGSGKTTLLHCLAGLDRPDRGQIWWGPTAIHTLPERRLARLRREQVGFVFQAFNLMPGMTAAQNVELPGRMAGHRPARPTVHDALARVGLAGRERQRPAQLSGGQQQRVAIARALVSRPRVLFADEPTGALDRTTGTQILHLLRTAVDHDGTTCVMVTHDPTAAAHADRVLLLTDGQLVDELHHPTARQVADALAAAGGEV
ncbi:ABC transporter ATP-binding protein [Kitasatospora sp. NPDC051984]|uniref:ABC transporter ATP-binding protein n=1 Tax=Kitasatospora sp. NPDC051984 TaxID=3364059 RepID=UPI0037C67C60